MKMIFDNISQYCCFYCIFYHEHDIW